MQCRTVLAAFLTGLVAINFVAPCADARAFALAVTCDDEKKTPPEVPDDWIVVEEDVWFLLVEEPDHFLQQAKARYDKGDLAGASKEINKAVAVLKLETAAAAPESRKPLEAAIFDLELLSKQVAGKKVKSAKVLDEQFARVHHDMAHYHERAALAAIKEKDYEAAGQELNAAAHHVDAGFGWVGEEVGTGLARAVEAAADTAGKLLGGADSAVASANKVISDLGAHIEALGKTIDKGEKSESDETKSQK